MTPCSTRSDVHPRPTGAARLVVGALVVAAGLVPRIAPEAAPGDVTVVKTFSFDSISTRRATFELPDDDRTWEKILLVYTLRCDERTTGDEYPCGEWDVTTHTRIFHPTGRIDSTRHEHPSFRVNGEAPDELRYSTAPRYHVVTYWDDPGAPGAGDRYLSLDHTDHVEIPAAAFATVDSALTIAGWVKGADVQPEDDHLLEACRATGRVVNIHLPWGTGIVYWDAGGYLSGANNRLTRTADPGDYKGRWTHWAFVKSLRDSTMTIYRNGERWHHAGNMAKAIGPVDRIILGANCNANGGWFAGALDDLVIWDEALDEAEIRSLRDGTLPSGRADALRLHYAFDDASGEDEVVRDRSPHGFHGTAFGLPERRPFGFAGRADHKPSAAAVLHADTLLAPRLSVERFDDPDDPTRRTSVMAVWPAHDTVFDGNGQVLSEVPIDEPEILTQEIRRWYGEPFEVIEEFEIGRFITPYGKRLDLGEDGFTWISDVTDYAPILRGTIDLQAANDFELLDLELHFVEGTPPREVRAIENLWPRQDVSYEALAGGDALAPVRRRLDPDAAGYRILSRISGHGHAGPRHCCEWDPKEHSLLVNGFPRFAWTVWRNCGDNPVYPQGGTWQFDRAGWCPSTWVDTHAHELTPLVTPGDEIVIATGIEPPDPDTFEGSGRYVVSHQLVSYGPPSFVRDVAVTHVLRPSDHDEYGRMNPVSLEPVVVIRNQGSAPLREARIRYGLVDGESSEHRWTGDLAFLESDTVSLPIPDWTGMRAGARFAVTVDRPDGKRDEYAPDDRMETTVAPPVTLPPTFGVRVMSPGSGRAAEHRWQITDADGEVVAARDTFEDDTDVTDPVALPDGAYRFTFVDDGEDGLIRHWWLRGSDPDSIGEDGQVTIVDDAGETLIDLGFDFAEGVDVEFFVGGSSPDPASGEAR